MSKFVSETAFATARRTFAAALGLGIAIAASPATARDLFAPDAYATYQGDPRNGEYLADASGCTACHASGEDLRLLGGGLKLDSYIGTFHVPNITAHAAGTGGWSNADYLNAVINGIAPDGRNYYPVFPYASYAGMKPEDVLDIKAFIETLPQSDNRVPRHAVSFPYNLDTTISLWKRRNFDTAAYQPGDGSQMSRGRYLVESVGACGECHTPRTLTYGLDREQSLKGEKSLTGEVAPDISTSRLAGVPAHTFTDLFLSESKKLSGSPVASGLKKKWLEGLEHLTAEDKLAMFAYLTGRKQEVKKPELEVEATCVADTGVVSASATGSSAAQADDFVGKYCRNCHGPGESAQGSFPAADLATIARNPAFVTPGNRNASLLYTSVTSGRMPYGASPKADEVEALGAWIDSLQETAVASEAKADAPPRARDILHWRGLTETALRDLSSLDERDRPFIRYFSYQSLYNGVFPCEEPEAFDKRLGLFAAGFRKLLNSVSLGPQLVMPVEVTDSSDLLVRVDMRDLKWDAAKWDTLTADYPYGYALSSDPALKGLAEATASELPVLRADWFMANATRPEMYHMLLELPENISELEERLGIDVNGNIRQQKVARAAFLEGSSGVSDHNRLLERHDTAHGGYYWKSYDFAGSRADQSLKQHPHGPADLGSLAEDLEAFHHDGGEMIFSLPNGLQGYYLSTAAGDRIDRGPTQIVSFRQRPIGKGIEIINGRSCMSCHADGIIAKRDQLRSFLETSASFTLAQRDVLLKMYVDQEELDRLYEEDRQAFLEKLAKIEATEAALDGSVKSRAGPGKEEVVTWFADFYEKELDFDMLAAEFEMTPDEFEVAIQRVRDPDARAFAIDWINQLKGGATVPRFEIEEQFATLIKPVLNLDPLERSPVSTSTSALATNDAPQIPNYKDASYRDDGYRAEDASEGALKLRIKVRNTDVFVDENLSFEVVANQACELQILYVEADGNVEVIPQQMIGEAFLKPNVSRTIPDPSIGALVFDKPDRDETLLLNCREGGLGNHRLSAADARKLVKKSRQPASRGLAVMLFSEKKKEAREKPREKGRSAIHMVTFNVQDRH